MLKEQRADDSMFRWRGDDPLETLMMEAFGATKCQGGATAPLFAGYLMGYTGDIMGYNGIAYNLISFGYHDLSKHGGVTK